MDVGVEQGRRGAAHRRRREVGHLDQRLGDAVELLVEGLAHHGMSSGVSVRRAASGVGGDAHGTVARRDEPRQPRGELLAQPRTAAPRSGPERHPVRRTLTSWTPRSRRCSAGRLGLVIGAVAVAATRWSERSADDDPAEAAPPLPRAWATCSSVLRSIAVVVDASDAVVNTSASAVSYGLVRHGELVHHRAAPPRPAGAPRRHDPRGRARADPRPEHDRDASSCGCGSRRIARLARADPRRGPHPRPPGRGDPPRLRRQRQPRAEDPGRRHLAARRGRRSTPRTTPRRSSGSRSASSWSRPG